MSAIARPWPFVSTLLRLGRISNLPTVWTNVLASSVISGGARADQLGLLLAAMTAFYIGGMYLNDFFDRAVDARDRPGRPIDAGEITASAVSIVGFGLLALEPEPCCFLETTDESVTYTWDVLPEAWRTGSKAADIAREIAFCAGRLTA